MAYVSQADKKRISSNLKPILKKFGIKGTLAVRNHSTIVLTLRSGKIDFLSDYAKGENPAVREDAQKFGIDVNPYWFHEHFSGKSKEFLTAAFAALKSADWYDESDAMTDYFNTAYYVSVHIGKWNKPYTMA
jgi:hypothetical protein